MLKKITGLQGSTLSGPHMTMGFGPFELPTRGLLQTRVVNTLLSISSTMLRPLQCCARLIEEDKVQSWIQASQDVKQMLWSLPLKFGSRFLVAQR